MFMKANLNYLKRRDDIEFEAVRQKMKPIPIFILNALTLKCN